MTSLVIEISLFIKKKKKKKTAESGTNVFRNANVTPATQLVHNLLLQQQPALSLFLFLSAPGWTTRHLITFAISPISKAPDTGQVWESREG